MGSTASSSVPGWYIEFQSAVLRQLPRPGEIDQFTVEGWLNNQQAMKRNLVRFFVPPHGTIPVKTSKTEPLLQLKGRGLVKVLRTTTRFVAKEKFVVSTDVNASVKISGLSHKFVGWFLSDNGKTEEPFIEHALRCHELLQSSPDSLIITCIGGEEKAETLLSETFSLMENQKDGEDGVLLNNGRFNIFYIKDKFSVLRTVLVYWCLNGWSVRAFSIDESKDWNKGNQIFSCSSL